MNKLMSFLKSLFRPITREDDLEKYLNSKSIKSPADVEFYIKQYDNSLARRYYW